MRTNTNREIIVQLSLELFLNGNSCNMEMLAHYEIVITLQHVKC